MKTSIEIDEEKAKLALKLTGAKTLRELVDKALDAMIAEARNQDMISMLGKGIFDHKVRKSKRDRAG